MQKTVVLNVVGLTRRLLDAGMPRLTAWSRPATVSRVRPAFPAVTCTAQADYLTGRYPETHGIVGNGWYFRDECEIHFWKQSNRLVQAPKVWDQARAADPSFTCANLFWWFNMYSTADYAVTPRPIYRANGLKLPDVYTTPAALREELQDGLGTFPLFDFWGPRASIESSRWIADAARHVDRKFDPTLTLVYLPHLDYALQRLGPADPAVAKALGEIDAVCGDLIDFYEGRGGHVVVLSEYGITEVRTPVHINRILREHGLVAVRDELGGEVMDPGASAAFAVADHQVAHVYVNDASKAGMVRGVLERAPGIELVLGPERKAAYRIDHARSGEFVVVSSPGAWFTYYYWLDDRRAPDFARTVEIHKKPGYDPVELFIDPAIRAPAAAVGWKLAKKALGFRTLMDVIPLDAALVRGSHGRPESGDADAPILMTRREDLVRNESIGSIDVHDLILAHLGAPHAR